MAKTETLTVEVPEELVAAMRGAVQDGEYRSDDEAISDALVDWNERRSFSVEDTEALRAACQEELEDEGPGVPMDEVFDRLEAKYKAMAESSLLQQVMRVEFSLRVEPDFDRIVAYIAKHNPLSGYRNLEKMHT